MKFQKPPIIILDIDHTLFDTDLFKERLAEKNSIDESEYIELLYLTEKKVFQELVIKRNIPINIFSSQKELLTSHQPYNDTLASKKLRDYLEDYKDYKIYLVDDHPKLLKEAKKFNKDIITILLQTTNVKEDIAIDKIIHKLEDLLPIIPTPKNV